MNHKTKTRRNQQYLDVTEFIMTQHRQYVLPSPHRTPLPNVQQLDALTPNNLPLVIEVGGMQLSPYFRLGQGDNVDIQFYDFTLQGAGQEDVEISEENQQVQEQNQTDPSQQELQDNQFIQQFHQIENSQPTIELPPSRLNVKSFLKIYKELKKIQATENQLKSFMSEYLTQQDKAAISIDDVCIQDLEQIVYENLRYIGPISWLQRKYKVQKYLDKKKNRVWKKKISYDCRKRVADNRLRVKGKFVTKSQVCDMLGVDQIGELQQDDIKQLLQNHKTQSKQK